LPVAARRSTGALVSTTGQRATRRTAVPEWGPGDVSKVAGVAQARP